MRYPTRGSEHDHRRPLAPPPPLRDLDAPAVECGRCRAPKCLDCGHQTSEPLVVSWCPRPGTAGEAQAILTAAGVPNFPDPVRCVAALAGVVPGAAPPTEPACAPLREGPARTLAEHEALALRQAGVPVLPSQLAA